MAKVEKEKEAEDLLVSEVETLGGRCKKLVEVGVNGFPDRTVFLKGKSYHVELKREHKGMLSPQQIECHRELHQCGCDTYVVWGTDGVRLFIANLTVQGRYWPLNPDGAGKAIHFR